MLISKEKQFLKVDDQIDFRNDRIVICVNKEDSQNALFSVLEHNN